MEGKGWLLCLGKETHRRSLYIILTYLSINIHLLIIYIQSYVYIYIHVIPAGTWGSSMVSPMVQITDYLKGPPNGRRVATLPNLHLDHPARLKTMMSRSVEGVRCAIAERSRRFGNCTSCFISWFFCLRKQQIQMLTCHEISWYISWQTLGTYHSRPQATFQAWRFKS